MKFFVLAILCGYILYAWKPGAVQHSEKDTYSFDFLSSYCFFLPAMVSLIYWKKEEMCL